MTPAHARAAVVEASQRLLDAGLVAKTWGSVSVRLDEATMAITPSGVAFPDLIADMVVAVDLETDQWSGGYRPSAERALHRQAYGRRPDVAAVVHTHQVAASICAAARVGVPTPLGTVPCAKHGLPGSARLARDTVAALGEGPAVLMANHGVLAVGASLDEAYDRVHLLERACAEHVVARRPREGAHMPADPDAPWDPSCLEPVPLRDGTSGWLSTAPFTLRFAELRRPMPPVLDDLAELASRRVRVLRGMPKRRLRADAVLVAGRGALVIGPDHEATAMVIERAARAWIGAAGLGGAVELPGWEARMLRARRARSHVR